MQIFSSLSPFKLTDTYVVPGLYDFSGNAYLSKKIKANILIRKSIYSRNT